MLVSQILRSKGTDGVMTVRPDISLSEAAQVLSDHRIGSLVVSEDGTRAVGILSERDIVRRLASIGRDCLDHKVADHMTREVVTCTHADSADEILEKMTAGRFRHIPVVEGDRLVGLVSIGDVVKARLSELAMEKDALEGMIKGF